MDNLPQERRKVSPIAEAHYLRRELMVLFRQQRRYQNFVHCDLAPLLRKAQEGGPLDAMAFRLLNEPHSRLRKYAADPYAAARAAFLKEHPEYKPQVAKLRKSKRRYRWHSTAPLAYDFFRRWIEEDREAMITRYRTFLVDLYCEKPGREEWVAIYQQLHDPQVRAYLEKLDWWLNGLRLLQDGQPAEWAAEFVHNDVLAAIGTKDAYAHEHSYYEAGTYQQLTIVLSAFTNTGLIRAEITNQDGTKRDLKTDFLPRDHLQRIMDTSVRLQPFDYLADARDFAQAAAAQWIEEVSTTLQGSHPVRNPSTLTRRREDMEILFAYLYRRTPLDDAEKKRLSRLCAQLKLDLPSNHRRADKNSA